jgi:phage tail-like protein
MARPSTKDPLDRFRWKVTVFGSTDGAISMSRSGFSQVEAPSVTITTNSYPEGGAHLFPLQIVDQVQYKPISLVRGVTSDIDFSKWARESMELVLGKKYKQIGNKATDQLQRQSETALDYRRDVLIQHIDRAGNTIKAYALYNAFPIEYQPSSDFASDGDDTVSMERLVLIYESFEVISIGKDADQLDPKDVFKRLIRKII